MSDALQQHPPAWVRWTSPIVRRLPSGRYRAMNWLCRRRTPPFVMSMPPTIGGYLFTCDLRDCIAREVCFTGQYEPQETSLVRTILGSGMTFVDVGANWGYFTLLAAHLVGQSGRVLSLEPDPRLFSILQNNMTRNHLHHVTLLSVAAVAQTGTVNLAGYEETDGNFGLSRVASNAPKGERVFRVAAKTLDVVLEEQGLKAVDLLKMDIEGAEGFALSGLAESLAHFKIHRLLLELHPVQLLEHGHDAGEIIARLSRLGYRGWVIDHSREGTRHASYERRVEAMSLLTPLEQMTELDAWPHILWTAPGLNPLP